MEDSPYHLLEDCFNAVALKQKTSFRSDMTGESRLLKCNLGYGELWLKRVGFLRHTYVTLLLHAARFALDQLNYCFIQFYPLAFTGS